MRLAVWKQQNKFVKNGWFSLLAIKKTSFSAVMEASSPFSTIMSFFKILTAHNWPERLDLPNMTLPKLPLPKTFKKLKSSRPIF
ncbi:hypothetical protein WICPIJ_005250 [Wickerhamomyces pijperi]|uniref:Uncharacterized protein n=1 Tax=Wickerhamomyces pijperi TaxID=599730 RepID=A0A9P8Q620_WICPI|nr:hypothetical protein WICPIJ_005250 [Wickerhamomyces pijperi]